ncbi:carboxymuconolactone decarboxylase family protein [Burkholderia sp. SCN-KJ]|uniref:carboxymuconolactone decarboxylase family protein n=1 Tax=Burkholderia sp. SCN-KJ TaxID=2969248 RepID=UPI00214FFA70|nr:carboxymuconolactone decarboxylase family protein [Burkholderia sp. SCN-KJ]MCR4470031.1 carboxymuconolactone decarboxylase family protein [Burkholderia sp. SCN-KJ]
MSSPKGLPYQTLSPEAYHWLGAVKVAVGKSRLGEQLIELVWLRTSQINGCAYCMEMHEEALHAGGVPDAKLDAVLEWHVSEHFTERERAALAWTEALTRVDRPRAPNDDYEWLKAYFGDVEISDLCFAIALMDAFNRLAIGTWQ